MTANSKKCIAAIMMAASLLSACATSTDMGTRQAGHQVSDQASVEAGFEFQAEKIEKNIQQSAALISDPALNQYVNSVANKITDNYQGELRIYIIESPVSNAFMLPNGAMVLYSGILLRMQNEAQLAFIMGHEFGHYVERHSLERHAAAQKANIGAFLASLATSGLANSFAITAAASSFYSNFSQSQELEADKFGLVEIRKGNYSQRSAIQFWQNRLDERANSSNKVKKRGTGPLGRVLSSHPADSKRLKTLSLDAVNSGGETLQAEFRSQIRPYLIKWLEEDLVLRDYSANLFLIDNLEETSEDIGVLEHARMRVYKTRNGPGDNRRAIAAALNATKSVDVPVTVWRDLGDLYQQEGMTDKARHAFKTYLTKAPSATDRKLIEHMLTNPEG